MEITFWIACFMIFLTYPGYPLLLYLIRFTHTEKSVPKDILPSVSFIITAYNEEDVIERKILNTFEIDYPKEKLEIIIISDFSTDGTDQIVRKYGKEGVRLLRTPTRGGKTAAQNSSLEHATGEILLFSDANTMYAKDAVKKIVRNFNDSRVGCVGGRLIYRSSDRVELIKEKALYQLFNQVIMKLEADIDSCVSLDGAIYAIRKRLSRPLPDDLTTDFLVPLDVISQGFRTLYEHEAVTYEEIPSSSMVEFRRKIRTVRAGLAVFLASLCLLNPLKYKWVAIFLIIHKLFRWITPSFMALLFAANLMILHRGHFYWFILEAQIVFYIMAIAGFFLRYKKPIGVFTIPFYFCLYNVACIAGIIKYLHRNKSEVWAIER